MRAVAAALLPALARGQQAGAQNTETHPPLTVQVCTTSGGCKQQQKSVVLDANWRWIHHVGGYKNCYGGDLGPTSWDTSRCPDPVTCAQNCAVEGADPYGDTYGITTQGSELTLSYVCPGGNVGSRLFLLEDENTYKAFKLKNKEFTFDVDASQLPCGLNGALYLVQMDADGGKSKYAGNNAGAKFGLGYCDAQCPHDIKFINGEANILNWSKDGGGSGHYGTCCTEMDLWEANSISSAITPHACSRAGTASLGHYRCEGVECGGGDNRFNGVCDANGCDFQTYRLGDKGFYGPGASFTVDSTKKVSVVTQFITADGTDHGKLTEIRRSFVQGGKNIPLPSLSVGGGAKFDSVTDAYCQAEVDWTKDGTNFLQKGGMASMDAALEAGMVLVMSLWDDGAARMQWLDGVQGSGNGAQRGTCDPAGGDPSTIRNQHPNSPVTYSNIKWGDIGSTSPGAPAP